MNSVNPGNVRTSIHRHFRGISGLPLLSISKFLVWLTFKTPYQGAQTSVHLLTDPSLAHVSGKYFRWVSILIQHLLVFIKTTTIVTQGKVMISKISYFVCVLAYFYENFIQFVNLNKRNGFYQSIIVMYALPPSNLPNFSQEVQKLIEKFHSLK